MGPSQLLSMRDYYNSGATRQYAFRKEQLEKLKSAILRHETELHAALFTDLKKSAEESWVTETGFLIAEINATLNHLHQWMQPERVPTNLLNLPSKSFVMREPLGVVFIIAPWNYPLQLLFTPLVGAIAAGNCVVLKASEFAPATAEIMGKIIKENFKPEYIQLVSGDGAVVVPSLMRSFRFDHVFYTGSTEVGKIIYKMAAEELVPVTLELGGKSPCVVESDADIKIAARRIGVTKFSNAGQMCVAPDYVLVHESVKEKFIDGLKKSLQKFYSEDPSTSYNYGKIINEKQFKRLSGYLSQGKIISGGKTDIDKLYIEPTIIDMGEADELNKQSKASNESVKSILTEEIFGPVLPIISFRTFESAKSMIDKNPNPLAFYVFTSDNEKERKWLESIPAGGSCVNNASWHLTNHNLPFGGRGNSGLGNYHGRNSFETFSHRKAVMKTPTWFDPDIKYPPFKGRLWLFKKIIR